MFSPPKLNSILPIKQVMNILSFRFCRHGDICTFLGFVGNKAILSMFFLTLAENDREDEDTDDQWNQPP